MGEEKTTEFHLGEGITFAFPAGSSKILCLLKSNNKRWGKDEAGLGFGCTSNDLLLQCLTRTDTRNVFLWEDGGLSHIHSPPAGKSLPSCCTKENSKGWKTQKGDKGKAWGYLVPHRILLHSHHPLLERIHIWELRKYWLLHAFSWKPTKTRNILVRQVSRCTDLSLFYRFLSTFTNSCCYFRQNNYLYYDPISNKKRKVRKSGFLIFSPL